MNFLMTCDVECYSFSSNSYDYGNIPQQVLNAGLPGLLDLFSEYDVEATFFFTGKFAELCPEAVELVLARGHEIGCHGYTHNNNRAFDSLPHDEQVKDLKRAKKIIEDIAGRVISFRAPALRINRHTIPALEKTGFLIDSSVASQRFDGPLTFGSKNKLKWITSPREPYNPSRENPFKRGNSSILEIPVSAFGLAYIGTIMRLSPTLFGLLERLLFAESKRTGRPLVFLHHPQENMPARRESTSRRSTSLIGHLAGDIIRHKLKMRNLGEPDLNLLEKTLQLARENFNFVSMRTYYKKRNEL